MIKIFENNTKKKHEKDQKDLADVNETQKNELAEEKIMVRGKLGQL